MGLTQIYAGYTANKGQLSLFNIPTQGLSITKASDSYITDSAAGATAMATGHKTNNRFISVDESGKPLELITQQLAKKNYKTAIFQQEILQMQLRPLFTHTSRKEVITNLLQMIS